jgi:uncharacterized protein (UPF0335 family)
MADIIEAEKLRLLIERIETLNEEKKGISDDIRDVYALVKGEGYDTGAVKTVIKLRAMEKNDRDEMDAILDVYREALGLA